MAVFKVCVQKKRSDGYYMVYIRIAHNNTIAYLKTNLLVNEKGIKKGEITDSFVNKKCAVWIDEYTDRCNRIGIKDWTAKEIADYLIEENKPISFSDYCREFIRRMDNEGRESTSMNYKLAIIRLEEFSGKSNLKFSDVTSNLINSWIESMRDTKKAKNGYPKAIKTMFQHGSDEYNDYDRNIIRVFNQPFRKVIIPKQKKSAKRAVEIDVLRYFFNTDIEKLKAPKGGWITRAERAKDVCLLIFCLAGMNTADLYDLKLDNRVGDKLCYKRKKTRGRRDDEAYIEIEIPDMLKSLFEKYKGKKSLFSFCEIYSNQKNFNKCINEGIGDIRNCYDSSHEDTLEYMTTYTMRHSWATIAQNNCGASTELVAFSLNHSSAHRVTEGYIKKDYSPISVLNEKVIACVFEK